MSTLSYLNHIIADVECENVSVEQTVGRYRLLFELSFVPMSWDGGQLQGYVPSLSSLRLVVKLNGTVIGTASPKEEDFLAPMHPQTRNAVAVRRSFELDIDLHTLDRIEQKRSEQDVSFELEVLGTATVFVLRDANFQHASSFPEPLGIEPLFFQPHIAKADVRHQVPQSEWIKLLDQMNYARVLLYEIPWPKSDDDKLNEAISHFESARKSFLFGFYTEAVGELRQSLDKACSAISCNNFDWVKVKNADARKEMQLQERFLFVWNSVRHLTHRAAHHEEDYSREEAHYILGMGALALSLAANAPGMLMEAGDGREDAG